MRRLNVTEEVLVYDDEKEVRGIKKRIMLLTAVRSVYLNKCDQPCSLSPCLYPYCSPISLN